MEARLIQKLLRLWKISCWYSNATNRMDWQRIAVVAVLALWVSLLLTIDLPLLEETRQIRGELTSYSAHALARTRSQSQQAAPNDSTRAFVASLPALDKCTDQLRAFDELAEKNGVSVASVHYRYESLPGLPITRVAMSVDAHSDDQRNRRFLQMMLNDFQNLAIARIVSTRSTDGVRVQRMKLDINLYFRNMTRTSP
jgi:site-specific recombinase